jgi:hypothetical protein
MAEAALRRKKAERPLLPARPLLPYRHVLFPYRHA